MNVTFAAVAVAPALAVGSFLNVVGSRMPLRRPVGRGRSACMSCGHEIAGAGGELHPGREVIALGKLRQDERGIGLVEVLIAIMIINVAILAMFAMFQAGALSILRASHTSNAAVLADKQMELYRAMLHTDIRLNDSLVSSADGTHTSASEWGSAAQQVTSSACTNTLPECMPTQASVTGADDRTYRIDTYIQAVTPSSGRAGKQVTVYVRLASDLTKVLAKLTANFDQATGCISGSTSNPC